MTKKSLRNSDFDHGPIKRLVRRCSGVRGPCADSCFNRAIKRSIHGQQAARNQRNINRTTACVKLRISLSVFFAILKAYLYLPRPNANNLLTSPRPAGKNSSEVGFDNYEKKNDSVYSSRVKAGKRRTYFFDVRTTRANDFYLTITESRKRFNDDGYDRHKIFLYKEDFNKFVKGLSEAVDYVKTDLMPDFDFDAFSHEYPEQEADEMTATTLPERAAIDVDIVALPSSASAPYELVIDNASTTDGAILPTALPPNEQLAASFQEVDKW